jgi:hypothetical protein
VNQTSAGSAQALVPGRGPLVQGALPRTTSELPPGASSSAPLSTLGLLRVTADRLNVRSEPKVSDENVLGRLTHGAIVAPLARVGDWVRIGYNGRPAFVHGGFVEPVTPAAQPLGAQADSDAASDGKQDSLATPAAQPVAAAAPSALATTKPASENIPSPPSVKPVTSAAPPSPSQHVEHAPTEPTVVAPSTSAATPSPSAGKDTATNSPSFTPSPNAKVDDPQLLELAHKIHDPKIDLLLRDLGTVIELHATLARNKDSYSKEVYGKDREVLIDGIATIHRDLEGLNAKDENVVAFTVAVNGKIQEISPYLFQYNIATIESRGGWSTCNMTALAMALEVTGRRATSYTASLHSKLLAVAEVFKGDISNARLASNGTKPDMASLYGLRFSDFLELAAVVEYISSATPSNSEISAAAAKAVAEKTKISLLEQLATRFGATATSKTVRFDASKTIAQNRSTRARWRATAARIAAREPLAA